MELKSSVLKNEIEALSRAPQFNISHTWQAVVNTPNGDYKALYVHWVKNFANYTVNFSDEMVIALAFPAGDYDYGIYNERDALEVTLTKIYTEPGATVMVKSIGAEEVVMKFRAKLMNPGTDSISQNLPGAQNRERLNATQTRDVKIQLIHPIADYLRKMSTGGTFSDCRGIDAVRAFLGSLSRKAASETNFEFLGVDVASGYKEDPSSSIVIKDHTPVIEIPRLINEESGGIYPTGFWYYIQGKHWYVYPKMDLQRYFTHTGQRLRIINIPRDKFPESNKTFTIKDRLITVLATGDVKQIDLAETEQENKGNGTRWIDPKRLFNDYIKRDKNKAVADTKKVMTEVCIKPRRDNTNFTTTSDQPITSRHNIEYSKLASRAGMLVQFTWESAAPELLYPGMPCSFVYLKNELEVEELTGIVTSVEWHSTTQLIDVKDRMFQTKAAVQVFVGRGIDSVPISHGSGGKGSVNTSTTTEEWSGEPDDSREFTYSISSSGEDGSNIARLIFAFMARDEWKAGKITEGSYRARLKALNVELPSEDRWV